MDAARQGLYFYSTPGPWAGDWAEAGAAGDSRAWGTQRKWESLFPVVTLNWVEILSFHVP